MQHRYTDTLDVACTIAAGSITTGYTGQSRDIGASDLELFTGAGHSTAPVKAAILNDLTLYFTKTQGSADEIMVQVTESDDGFTTSYIVPIMGALYYSIKSSTYADSTVYRLPVGVDIRGKEFRVQAKYSGGSATGCGITVYHKLNSTESAAPSGAAAIVGSSGLTAEVRPIDYTADEGLAYSAAVVVSGGAWAADVVTFTATAHGYDVGSSVTVSGCGNASYNGIYTVVSAPTANTFTAALTPDPGAFTTNGSVLQAQSTTRLIDETKSWTADEWSTKSATVEITSGTGHRQYATITDNGNRWLEFSAMTTAPVTSDSTYQIIESNVNALVCDTEIVAKIGSITVNSIDAGKYRSTQPDLAAGESAQLNLDIKGNTTVSGSEAHDAAAARAPVRVAGYASDAAPTDVADGDVVNAWHAQNGAKVMAGYDTTATLAKAIHIATDDAAMPATPDFLPIGGEYRAAATTYSDGDAAVLQLAVDGALKVSASATYATLDDILLNAVVADGNGTGVEVIQYPTKVCHVIAASVSTGATVAIEGSCDNSNWYTIDSTAVGATGAYYVSINESHRYVRASISGYVDGTYTVSIDGRV